MGQFGVPSNDRSRRWPLSPEKADAFEDGELYLKTLEGDHHGQTQALVRHEPQTHRPHLQAGAKSLLCEIWQAETRKSADQALDRFVATYEAKYPKAADCLARDRETLFAFYDFPAAHWQHLRTTNPIESTFATIRMRTVKTRNCLSVNTALSLLHQLAISVQKRRRLRGFGQFADLVAKVKFVDGIDEREIRRKAA